MSDSKQVKVDNWGIYFLQRLKHFFNRTDYCDLTLQFQDNAQLKVHRLVLNACTEYFEILERTCEMYEDCLIMPDDLQADVVVPIVNFMYTGQLEFKPELLEKLYQTSHVMNMPVLTKLLDAQRKRKTIPAQDINPLPTVNKLAPKRFYNKAFESSKAHHVPNKRPYILSQANQDKSTNQQLYYKNPKTKEIIMVNKPKPESTPRLVPANKQSGTKIIPRYTEPKPTRYEVPDELDPETLYDDSFTDLSYESRPLMVHPETSKRYQRKKNSFGIFSDASSSRISYAHSSLDIVECKKIAPPDPIFEDPFNDIDHDNEFDALKKTAETSSFFDEESVTTAPKVFIEGKESNQKNIDHAKIISEVLKKYPHLMKKNKNIKLKILDAPAKVHNKIQSKKQQQQTPLFNTKIKPKPEKQFESEVLDSKEAARLIALGAENVSGPWICLICGAPGKALNFVSYYKFRRHLVEVHREKEIPSLCEYCGLRSTKRNYMLHHLYSKHGIPPPSMYNFPKCRQCDYIGLTPAILVKHEASHTENKILTCNSCHLLFRSTNALLAHYQRTGHKIAADKKVNLQCVYCMKSFVRESNLYAHLKTCHKKEAKRDGILEYSDDDEIPVKFEPAADDDTDDSQEMQYNIEQSPDGKLQVTKTPQKQKLLNEGYNKYIQAPVRNLNNMQYDDNDEEMEVEIPMSHGGMGSNEGELILGDSNTDGQDMYVIEQSMPIVYGDGDAEQNIKPNIQSNNTNQIQFIMENDNQYKAMVSSGQSIIYDTDGNATKTLAVLTTPDASNFTQGTTIDLNNASNEMMLFQDGYPINVTESVSDNQNIVVVYSHALNNGNNQIILNAQGQIISSESPVYQTIPKPEVTGNDQMNIQHWQGNTNPVTANQQTVYTDASGSQIIVPNVEYVQQQEEVETEQTQNENVTPASVEVDELPAVNLDNQLLVLQQQTKNHTQTNQVLPSLPQIDDGSSLVIQNASEGKCGSKSEDIERNDISNAAKIDNATLMDVDCSNKEVSSEVVQTNDELAMTQQPESPTYTQNYKIDIEVPPAPPQKVIEKIQNLTSEWSEDEDETEETIKHGKITQHIELPQEEDSEETIENIQKELNKCDQRHPISSNEVEENKAEDHPKQTANNIGSSNPPEKINTLLNDWEENESQKEHNLNEGTEMQVENNLHENSVQESNNLHEESNTHEENVVQEAHDYEQGEENEMQGDVVHEQNELQEETELQKENNLQEETELQHETNLQEDIESQEGNELQNEDNLPEEIESPEENESQTNTDINDEENGLQEENNTQEEKNSDEAKELEENLTQHTELDKQTTKSKQVPNIRSLVSDWDEDEEVKEGY